MSDDDVRAWAGATSYQRGYAYFRDEYIFNLRLQGDALKAKCQGSRPDAYDVQVNVANGGIASAQCSCPVGDGGHCKHVAALLLTWLHGTGPVAKVEPVDAILARMDREQLIVLIQRMLRRDPDLESLLELPIPGSDAYQDVNPDVIRRQVYNAFSGARSDWDAASDVARELDTLVQIGRQYVERGNWLSAKTVLETVARAVLDNVDRVQDEDGELQEVIGDCVQGLSACLEATADATERERILQALFHIYLYDIRHGGIGMGDESPAIIVEQATPEERRRVAAWVRDAFAAHNSSDSHWMRQSLGGFLLSLEEDSLDDEAYLALCREADRTDDLIGRLLTLGRVKEALTTARAVDSDYFLLALGDIFAKHGQVIALEPLVEERVAKNEDERLTDWLSVQAERRGDLERALLFAEKTLQRQRRLPAYQRVRSLAELLGKWHSLRQSVIAELEAHGSHALLTEVYLDEGLIEAALHSAIRVDQPAWGWNWSSASTLRIKVAQAAEATHPRDAIQIYQAEAEQIIHARARAAYPTAVSYLQQVRSLCAGLGEAWAWDSYVSDLRLRTKQLRALRADMAEAGL